MHWKETTQTQVEPQKNPCRTLRGTPGVLEAPRTGSWKEAEDQVRRIFHSQCADGLLLIRAAVQTEASDANADEHSLQSLTTHLPQECRL